MIEFEVNFKEVLSKHCLRFWFSLNFFIWFFSSSFWSRSVTRPWHSTIKCFRLSLELLTQKPFSPEKFGKANNSREKLRFCSFKFLMINCWVPSLMYFRATNESWSPRYSNCSPLISYPCWMMWSLSKSTLATRTGRRNGRPANAKEDGFNFKNWFNLNWRWNFTFFERKSPFIDSTLT